MSRAELVGVGSLPPLKHARQRLYTWQAALLVGAVLISTAFDIWQARVSKEGALSEATLLSAPSRQVAEARTHRGYTVTWWSAVVRGGVAVLLGAIGLAIARRQDKEVRPAESVFVCALHVLYEVVRKRKNLTGYDDPRFRVTLHRVGREHHEQYTPYVGWRSRDKERHPGRRRRWLNSVGLVGWAVRMFRTAGHSSQPLYVADVDDSRKTPQEVRAALVNLYGYTNEQARELSADRLSSMVVLILDDGGEPVAALYCDSSERRFFCYEVQEAALTAGIGIASFVRLKYL